MKYKKISFSLSIIIVFIVFAIFICFLWRTNINARARQLVKEAKNVQLTIRLLSLDYYANGNSVYDITSHNGFAEGVADEVRELSGVRGEFSILAWDTESNTAARILYEYDDYIVDYRCDPEGNYTWKVYKDLSLFKTKTD